MTDMILNFLMNHLTAVICYCVGVLFPIPGLSRMLLDLWSKIGATLVTSVKNLFAGKETIADATATATLVETSVAGSLGTATTVTK